MKASTLPTLIDQSTGFLAVVGPTATGKTSFVLDHLAPKILTQTKFKKVWLISADSRQVYREISILSGADVPKSFEFVPVEMKPLLDSPKTAPLSYFQANQMRIYGVGVISANQDWSAADFRNLVLEVLSLADASTLVVIVGGSGFYYRYLFQDSPEMVSKPDPKFREKLVKKSVAELQAMLRDLSTDTYAKLNESDLSNRRRLIRKIEQLSLPQIDQLEQELWKESLDLTTIGLTADKAELRTRIEQRVKQRWQAGAIDEVKNLRSKYGQDFDKYQLATATGVKEINQYLTGELTDSESLSKWITREFKYAKRQLTWFKKEPAIEWYDVLDKNWQVDCLNQVLKSFSTPL